MCSVIQSKKKKKIEENLEAYELKKKERKKKKVKIRNLGNSKRVSSDHFYNGDSNFHHMVPNI